MTHLREFEQTFIQNPDGTERKISTDYPIPTDADAIYSKDIWVDESDMGNFSGVVTDLFDNLHSVVTDTTTTNPKEITIHLNKTLVNNVIGLGAYSGSFSNVLIKICNSGGVYTTVIDESTDSTLLTSETYQIPVTAGYNALKIQFHTANTITLSNIVMLKTRSVIARLQGLRDDGTVNDVVISNSNRLRVVSQPYTFAISEGDIPGHDGLLKFGTRENVAANTESTCWEGPTARYVYMTTAQQLKVSSTSTSDTAVTGTGARTLRILGLDSNYDEIEEDIDLAGTGVVTTSNSYLRVFRSFVLTCGTSLTNVGTISINNNAGTVTQAIINPDDGQTLMALWTVPRGKTAYIIRGGLSTSSNKGARISFFIRLNNGGITYPWLIKYRGYLFSGAIQVPIDIPYVVPELTDFEITVKTPGNAGTTELGGTFELWYE